MSSSSTGAIAFPTGAIYQERDHNPCLIEYPCVVLQSKPGEEWNEGQTLFQILICCDLNPVSTDTRGKVRWVWDRYLTFLN